MEQAEEDELIQWMQDNLFHFSCKTVNSNAQVGGVRLGAEQALDLPYISARTLLTESAVIGLDYLVNAGKDATHFKKLRQALGEIERVPAETLNSDHHIRTQYQQLAQHHRERGLDSVSPRLRQLLIPKEQGYVAITPLGSSGLCEWIQSVVKQREKSRAIQAEPEPSIGFDSPVNQLSVGGSNPQNVGGRVRAMSRPLVFYRVPNESAQARTALSLFHRGFRPRLPRALVQDYADYLSVLKASAQTMTLAVRDKELALIRPMLHAIQAQAVRAMQSLAESREALPDTPSAVHADLLPWLELGASHAERRAQWLVATLSGYRLGGGDGAAQRLILSPEDERRLRTLIEEIPV